MEGVKGGLVVGGELHKLVDVLCVLFYFNKHWVLISVGVYTIQNRYIIWTLGPLALMRK